MSADENATTDDTLSCCASCGIADVDNIKKLKECDDCDLVRYCSDECQRDHKPQHEEACKKRTAELRDELLFKQPKSTHLGDCPICNLPLSLDRSKSSMYYCCSNVVCNGCIYAYQIREMETRRENSRLQYTCPFCREPFPTNHDEGDRLMMKRVEANDLIALCQEGAKWYNKEEYSRAFKFYAKAADLGDAHAHYQLSAMYNNGFAVEKDEGKQIRHLEEAAIGGHPFARYNLGLVIGSKGKGNIENLERAIKHWIIAAAQGCDFSIKELMEMFKQGILEKDHLGAALRAYQTAVEATKSPQRKAAAEEARHLW